MKELAEYLLIALAGFWVISYASYRITGGKGNFIALLFTLAFDRKDRLVKSLLIGSAAILLFTFIIGLLK